MRFVRRASLIFSLVLIVAIFVGYVARTAELSGDRDARLTAAAELGGTRLSALVQSATVAAAAGGDAAAVSEVLARAQSGVAACAIDAGGHECAGDGPRPARSTLDAEQSRRADLGETADDLRTSVSLYESVMTIEAIGAHQTVIVTSLDDAIDVDGSAHVKVTTLLAADTTVGGFSDAQGRRITSTVIPRAAGVFVVASDVAAVELPADELRFYVIIFALALVLMLLAGITLVVEHRSLVERASFDSLTRLPNRGEFERRAADIIDGRHEPDACLLLFDLNGFKQINDTHGHLAGDEVLKVVGSRLRKAVRDGDIVARWGGDEFVVLMPGIGTEEMGSRRALQLAEQVSGRTRVEGVDDALRVKVSVGVAVWPLHGADLDDLVVAADRAMYQAKRDGVTCRVASAPVADLPLSISPS